MAFFVLGLAGLLTYGRPRLAALFSVLTGLIADLILPAGIFGTMIIWHLCFYFLARQLLALFFTVNKITSLALFVFIAAWLYKSGLVLIDIFGQWWNNDSASVWPWFDFVNAAASALLTSLALVIILIISRRFSRLSRRFFLIRH
ncbi:MAG: hypothetical protein Q8L21_01525 [Candidatus Komeilibacteria bacterium]|nr:hypothetical protein [Candidatus Komeilibacteria bacterium]